MLGITHSRGSYTPPPDPLTLDLPLPPEHPRPSEWRTPPLWGVADSAPYLHDGTAATFEDAILRHDGDAAFSAGHFRELEAPDRATLLAFLGTLRAPGYVQHQFAGRNPAAAFEKSAEK